MAEVTARLVNVSEKRPAESSEQKLRFSVTPSADANVALVNPTGTEKVDMSAAAQRTPRTELAASGPRGTGALSPVAASSFHSLFMKALPMTLPSTRAPSTPASSMGAAQAPLQDTISGGTR